MLHSMFAYSVKRIICPDICSDIILMPPDLFRRLSDMRETMQVRACDAAQKYGLAAANDGKGKDIYVLCDKEIKVNIELFIRHGFYLELCNKIWYVAMSGVTDPLLERSSLEALGINTKDLLAAATDQMGS